MLSEFQAALGAAFVMVATFVPRLLGFLAVLLIGWLVAKLLRRATDAVLERVGFDKLVERGRVKTALERTQYDASSLLSQVVFYIVMLFVLQLSFGAFGDNPVSAMLDRVIAYLPNVFAAGVIVVVGAAIAAAVADLVSAGLGSLTYGKVISAVASGAILVVAVFAALTQLQIAPAIVVGLFYAMLAATVGIAVVAVGGAGVQPMRPYWQRMLTRVDQEVPAMTEAAREAPDRAKERVEERREQAREAVGAGAGRQQQPGRPSPSI